MIKIERLRFRHIWSMMTRSTHECLHASVRTNECVRTNMCKTSVFVVSIRNINICGKILTQFTGLLRTNTVAAKRNILAERTGLGKSVSVSLRKNGPNPTLISCTRNFSEPRILISVRSSRPAESYRNTNRGKYVKLDYIVLEEVRRC